MKNLIYISNIPKNQSSGGMSGINAATSQRLALNYNLNYKYIEYKHVPFMRRIIPKIKKWLSLKKKYVFFSESRLKYVAGEIESEKTKTDFYFFHGFTPWIKTILQKPYFAYNDACFATYVENYNVKASFSQTDLERIYFQEAEWLRGAKKVFFQSKWALNQTKIYYNIEGANFENVGVGGFIDIPEKDEYKSEYNFLFISREFIPKGGVTAVTALKLVKQKYPEAKLWIVGQKPPDNILKNDGVVYKGFFHKNIDEEKKELFGIFGQSFALIHPTIKDINPLVIVELAYFGCPAISTNAFAIPEYLLDGDTGFLLQQPRDEKELAEKMILLIEDSELYNKMRTQARENAIHNNTWEKVGQRIVSAIDL